MAQLTTIKPFAPEQRAFCQKGKRYIGYVSGVGAGKTYGGIIRTLLNMEQWNVGDMGAIVAPTTQMIKNVIIPEMRDMGLFDPPINYEYRGSRSTEPGLVAPNGSRALILSADNDRTIERLRGLNLAWGWIDEEAVVPPRARQILQQRLRTGSYRNLFITTTPKGKNHTYNFFVRDVDAERYELGEATVYESEDTFAIVGVPTGRNPHTPTDYKEAMERDMPDAIRAQEIRGQFIEIGSGILTSDMLQTAYAEDVLTSDELTFHVGVDIGIQGDKAKAEQTDSDYWAAAVIAHHRRHGKAYIIDVARQRGMSLKQGVSWLRGVIQNLPYPTIAIEAVQAQRWFLDECREQGLDVYGVQQHLKKEDRLIQLSVPFENGTIKLVNFDEQKQADDRWGEFIQEWIAFPEGSHDDLLDAVEIGLRELDVGATFDIEAGDIYRR